MRIKGKIGSDYIKRITMVIALSFAFLLGACTVSKVAAEQASALKIWPQNRNGQMETWVVVDSDTGVNYVVVAPSYSDRGNSYDGIAITPLLDKDGAIYVSK